MSKEKEDKIDHLKKEQRKLFKKFSNLMKSSPNNKMEKLKENLKKSQEIRGEILKLSNDLGRSPMGWEDPYSKVQGVINDCDDAIYDAIPKLEEIIVRKLEGSPVRDELRSLQAQVKSKAKVQCRFCEKPLYDETVTLCMSCVRFQSKDEMLEYRNTHPDEVDRGGRLMLFPDSQPSTQEEI